MNKAEELSQNRYPTMAEKYAFIDGYEQAEKDLELSWEDIASINDIITEVLRECDNNILYDTEESFCREVLKRFKKKKETKY